ncbi:osmoprotectant ABC transporter substrate-binding protein [Peptoniphilus equinus]|uniref:Osmoprotectant ABC transporter substrate-binding protein n=1 Tax=Peptoniphilus equinus TaxID=3016343 RepID=A0ABY7QW23_9FIRM|nr:osmoprotectant ABC transporter substrate-binding protein [Peptoniphilus equinus]WBW50113.1 osmoprotectant ABC transporter substrate-binding protein [Peptoniphilus equinus]
MKHTVPTLSLAVVLLVALTGCSFPGLGGNTDTQVVIAAGNTTERQILAHMIVEMIHHHTDLKTNIVNNLGSTILVHTAMTKGDVNMSSAMYTGTSLTGELGMEPVKDPDEALKLVQDAYLDRFDRVWYPSYGFANTYAFMVKDDFAKAHNLTKVSDLEALKDTLKVGVDTSWIQRPGDGYEGFQELYGFAFKNIYPMEIALVYSAINNGEMDVVLGYSTDGRINSYGLTLLEDDRQLFPPYDASPVASRAIVEKYPELDVILNALAGSISSDDMQRMNKTSDEDLVEPQVVAQDFLKAHKYFEARVNELGGVQ